jgi:hypothetical protein
MCRSGLADHSLDVEGLTKASIELSGTEFNFGAQFVECVDALEQLATKLLLGSVRQSQCAGYRQFQRLRHGTD